MEIKQTETFRRWRERLKDSRARATIAMRLTRLLHGLMGDVKAVGEGVSELRIDCGPGYRVYFKRYGDMLIALLRGGDKRTQAEDIRLAKKLAMQWSES